jgi:hypothetical protein
MAQQNYHPNGYCEGSGICDYCGRTLFDEYFKPFMQDLGEIIKENKKMKIIGVEELDAFDNNTLQQQGRNVHGALYKRINTLQRDLNISRETLKRSQAYAVELENKISNLSHPQTQIPPPIMQALRIGGMPERFNTIESITDWIKLIVHL